MSGQDFRFCKSIRKDYPKKIVWSAGDPFMCIFLHPDTQVVSINIRMHTYTYRYTYTYTYTFAYTYTYYTYSKQSYLATSSSVRRFTKSKSFIQTLWELQHIKTAKIQIGSLLISLVVPGRLTILFGSLSPAREAALEAGQRVVAMDKEQVIEKHPHQKRAVKKVFFLAIFTGVSSCRNYSRFVTRTWFGEIYPLSYSREILNWSMAIKWILTNSRISTIQWLVPIHALLIQKWGGNLS